MTEWNHDDEPACEPGDFEESPALSLERRTFDEHVVAGVKVSADGILVEGRRVGVVGGPIIRKEASRDIFIVERARVGIPMMPG